MQPYNISTRDGPRLERGHIVRVAGVDLGLRKVKGGYTCDHVRSGWAVDQLSAVSRLGPAVTLAEAKRQLGEPGVTALLDANRDTMAAHPTLNEGFD